jgi:hypothetical protein
MMGLETIRQLSAEAATKAAQDDLVPFRYWNADAVEEDGSFPFPFLGDYVPEGWELVGTHFVDSSGWGQLGEAALTANQFRLVIKSVLGEHPKTGWAITEAGQFQVYVGEYRKVE